MTLSSLLHDIKSGTSSIWALVDQGVISLGSFLTTVILARTLEPSAYGLYALILASILFFNSIQSALLCYPLIVQGATISSRPFQNLVLTTLLMSSVLAAVSAILTTLLIWFLESLALGLAVGAAIFMWQLQQVMRHAFMAHSQYRASSVGDAFSFLGRAALVGFVARDSITEAFFVTAFTAFVALLVQMRQMHLIDATAINLLALFKAYWKLSSWAVLATLSGALSMPILVFGIASFHGTAEVAKYHAVANVLGVTNPILQSLGSLVLPTVAVTFAAGTIHEAKSAAFKRTQPLILFLAPCLSALAFMPSLGLKAFYGSQSPYVELVIPVRWLVLAYSLLFMAGVLSGVLDGVEQPKYRLFMNLSSLATMMVVGGPLIVLFGVEGASAGYAISILASALVALKLISRLERVNSSGSRAHSLETAMLP